MDWKRIELLRLQANYLINIVNLNKVRGIKKEFNKRLKRSCLVAEFTPEQEGSELTLRGGVIAKI